MHRFIVWLVFQFLPDPAACSLGFQGELGLGIQSRRFRNRTADSESAVRQKTNDKVTETGRNDHTRTRKRVVRTPGFHRFEDESFSTLRRCTSSSEAILDYYGLSAVMRVSRRSRVRNPRITFRELAAHYLKFTLPDVRATLQSRRPKQRSQSTNAIDRKKYGTDAHQECRKAPSGTAY